MCLSAVCTVSCGGTRPRPWWSSSMKEAVRMAERPTVLMKARKTLQQKQKQNQKTQRRPNETNEPKSPQMPHFKHGQPSPTPKIARIKKRTDGWVRSLTNAWRKIIAQESNAVHSINSSEVCLVSLSVRRCRWIEAFVLTFWLHL